MFRNVKKRWMIGAICALIVGTLLYIGSPRALASTPFRGMMGSRSNAMGQMMQQVVGQGENNANGINNMHTPAMLDAMKNGTMVDYMNSPEIKEQFKDTPMGQFMYSDETQALMQSPEMQNLLQSDAYKKFADSPAFQQMMGQGGAGCHGAPAANNQPKSQSY